MGRLRTDRQRRRPQAGTLRTAPLHPARHPGALAPELERWASDGEFVPGSDEDGGGRWQYARPVPQDGWPLAWRDVRFTAQCTPFRHLGFFPDMAPVWDWMGEQLSPAQAGTSGGETVLLQRLEVPACAGLSTLNLFGYTGVGTLALSAYGPVTHVDASKKSVAQARANAELSGMAERPIRWIVDDAAKFAAREVRRGKRYDGIILDPPKFGRGPEGEVWRLEEAPARPRRRLPAPARRGKPLPVPDGLCGACACLAIAGLLADLRRSSRHDRARRPGGARGGRGARLLPTAIFARWSNPAKRPRAEMPSSRSPTANTRWPPRRYPTRPVGRSRWHHDPRPAERWPKIPVRPPTRSRKTTWTSFEATDVPRRARPLPAIEAVAERDRETMFDRMGGSRR